MSVRERVIEIGVGTGRIPLPVAPFVRHYVGVDLSTAMMRRLLDKRAAESVSVIHGDASHLPLPTHAFDAAVASHIFHLIPTYQEALAELARTLKPQSRLVHCWTKKDQAVDVESIMKQIFPDGSYGGRADAVGARGTTFFEEAGWTKVGTEMHTFTRQQKPIEVVDQMQRRVWSRTWRMSDEQLATSVAALRAAIEQMYPDIYAPVEVQSVFHADVYTSPL